MAMTTDPIYASMDSALQRRKAEQRKRSPRAVAVRDDLLVLYRRLPLADAVGDRALKAADYMSQVIADGDDITADQDASLRYAFRLPGER